jgi:hypothetical protein
VVSLAGVDVPFTRMMRRIVGGDPSTTHGTQ